MSKWTTSDLPRLDGKVIVITGANSGIGFEAARALAGTGARVVLACRNTSAAEKAAAAIQEEHAGAAIDQEKLDLSSLASVRAFAARFGDTYDRLDVLINNAGVMALPRCTTADGFEMQFGTNHLGHFALTGLLLPHLLKSAPARVVTVSSAAHQIGWMRFEDLQREKGYQRWLAYGQSKLANLLFAYELDRRVKKAKIDLRSVTCHPGYSATNLQYQSSRMEGAAVRERFWRVVNALFGQSAAMGALPTLYAAAAPEAQGGEFIGPGGLFAARGYPTKQRSNARSRDEAAAARLWSVSEELTGVTFSFAPAARAFAAETT
jgi:NAD(P)-dependent dehydrogenase (short-subunit alcohol dehydrogenase family)